MRRSDRTVRGNRDTHRNATKKGLATVYDCADAAGGRRGGTLVAQPGFLAAAFLFSLICRRTIRSISPEIRIFTSSSLIISLTFVRHGLSTVGVELRTPTWRVRTPRNSPNAAPIRPVEENPNELISKPKSGFSSPSRPGGKPVPRDFLPILTWPLEIRGGKRFEQVDDGLRDPGLGPGLRS